ncbi:hypothetical protein N5C81_05450 [Rhizobium pusense]|uniref:hypothetical protein n=1 Tax=Agrobacterium pusense TaxID=648995 RepID=UPI002447FCFD|nr:hypothetical protein [Agrobacterium pusense]MDH1267058.1 hypothetical protein [Agrobacterium pusense]
MLMRREQVVPTELAITTFDPLDKYVAANDNVPVGNVMNSPLNGGLIGTAVPHGYTTDTAGNIRPLSSDNGQYIGLTRQPQVGEVCINNGELCVFDGIDFAPAEPPRTGDFMQVFSGRKYWPMDPRPHEVHIEDIAHSLAMQARYAGHCIKFLSVAEHSVLIARHLAAKHAPEVALAGLLHDAPEAYCVDIPRPLKPYLTNYKEIEQKNWLAIAARFQLDRELPDEVHDADNRIIADELVNLVPMPWHARHNNPLGVKLRYWSPEKAEQEFMATFDALIAGRAA